MDQIVKQPDEVKLIVFACEAGMGSSLMGANQLKKMVKKAKLDGVTVIHSPVGSIPAEADVIVTHTKLAQAARAQNGDAAIVRFMMFMNDPKVKAVVENLKTGQPIVSEL